MAKKPNRQASKPVVSEEIRRFLSENGKKGGKKTRELIQAGKEATGEA